MKFGRRGAIERAQRAFHLVEIQASPNPPRQPAEFAATERFAVKDGPAVRRHGPEIDYTFGGRQRDHAFVGAEPHGDGDQRAGRGRSTCS